VPIPEIDIAALADLHAQGATIIDVRNPDEYETAHVPGATLIPLPEVADRLGELPTDRRLYLICAVGGRSLRAGEFLAAQGLDVVNIAGGTKGWIAAGHPTNAGPTP
jgi:rhodanese-related sulfurtransferase